MIFLMFILFISINFNALIFMRFYMDFLIRDCILCPITNVLKMNFFGLLLFITLIHLRDKPL